MKRLSNSEAERVIRELEIVDDKSALRAAHRLHKFWHPHEASELVEGYASTEVEKYEQRKVTNVNTNTRS
jgi:hypothetical protein